MLETYVLHITKECNCDCKYCYEKDKTSKYKWEEIKILLDNIIKYNKEFVLEFLGGEPCLRFDLIQQTYNYLENLDVNVHEYVITTNGTILTEEILNFLVKNEKIRFSISIDGTKFMNSLRVFKDGKNTYDDVVKNIKTLRDYNLLNKVSVHITTHPYNIGSLDVGIKHLYEMGIREIGIGTIESTINIGREYFERYIFELNIVSEKIINKQYEGLFVDVLCGYNAEERKNDKRHYIYDDSGKKIAESYGRAKNDITESNKYKSIDVSGEGRNLIKEVRAYVNHIHKERLKNANII